MRARRLLALGILACAPTATRGEEFLDLVDQALTVSVLDDRVRLRLSGTLDLEYYHVDDPPLGLVDATARDLFNPRLSLFLDAQLGPQLYAFVQARLDRGFDPTEDDAEARLDEYALRFTPWEDARINFQIGKFSPAIGNWMTRHLSWDNPFVTAPVPYEHATAISDIEVPLVTGDFDHPTTPDTVYEYLPLVWGAAYTTGASVTGRVGRFEYAAEVKNAAPSSRPDSWDVTRVGFEHPTVSGRVGFRPDHRWNLGLSAMRGAYLRDDVEPDLPHGRDIGDYQQMMLAQDVSFATGHLQLWAECYQARFEVPRVGHADTVAYYIEAKYKFTPECFGALRWNQQFFSSVPDGAGGRKDWGEDIWRADAAVGYRFTPHTQLKLQYSLEHQEGARGHTHAFAAQFTVRF
jgi:hypothetical protein